MTKPHAYDVAVYHDGKMVGDFTMDSLPYPGLVLIIAPGIWQVERVMLTVPDTGSITLLDGDPWPVDVIATPTRGIHVD